MLCLPSAILWSIWDLKETFLSSTCLLCILVFSVVSCVEVDLETADTDLEAAAEELEAAASRLEAA